VVLDDIASLSVNKLLEMLHNALVDFAGTISSAIEANKAVALEDITQLREHLRQRLATGEEKAENQKLIRALNLLYTDQRVLEIIKEDADGWLELLDAIERHIEQRSPMTKEDKQEIQLIKKLSNSIRDLIRKEGA